jgi:tetratricopeptide (TPR) repeat protein
MNNESEDHLLIHAELAYRGVVGDPKRFGPAAARAVEQARSAGVPEALVVGLRALAWYERSRSDHARAKALLDEAVRVANRHNLPGRLHDVLVTRAAVRLELGAVSAALRDLDRAAAIPGLGASVEHDTQRAAVLYNVGRLADAATICRKILASPDVGVHIRAKMTSNLAWVEAQLGRPEQALQLLDRADELAVSIGGSALVAEFASNRAWILARAGRLVDGLRQADKAVELIRAAGAPPLTEHYVELADTMLDLRLLPEAMSLAESAAEEFARYGIRLMAGEAVLRIAQIALTAGNYHRSAESATAVADEFRRQRRPAWAARAELIVAEAARLSGSATRQHLNRARRAARTLDRLGAVEPAIQAHLTAGRIAADLGDARAARPSLRRTYELSRKAPVLLRAQGQLAQAIAAELDGQPKTVLRHCRSGLSDLRRHRGALASMELRALAGAHGFELGVMGIEALIGTGSPGRMFDWLERARSAVLVTAEPHAVGQDSDALAELRAAHAQLSAARLDGSDPTVLLAQQASIEARIRRAAWSRTATVTEDTAMTPSRSQLRRQLDGRVLVVQALRSRTGELFAVVLEPSRTRIVWLAPLKGLVDEADALRFALRRLASAPAPSVAAASLASAEHGLRLLREQLIDPLGLPPDLPLVVVPASRLHALPWSAMHDAPIEVAPSATLWWRSTQRHAEAAGTALVAGPGLPGADAEVQVLHGHYPDATVLMPPASTTAAVADVLASVELAHLACHGNLRADNPTFSALELADGPLTVHELDLRGIAPRRVVLASCDAAADTAYVGEDMLGFVSALLSRGTAGLVASSVQVPDLETADLMAELHRQLIKGARMADALHAARQTIDASDPTSLATWSAFTVYGAA